MLTEQRNPRSARLDAMSAAELAALINEEDATIAGAVRDALPSISAFIVDGEARMRAGGRLVYLGAGTSGRLGVLDASECPPTFQTQPEMVVGIIAGGDGALRKSSEGAEDDPRGAMAELTRLTVGARDCVLGIAAGGTTPYVLGALEIAKSRGALTALLVCTTIEKPAGVDHLLVVLTGPEVLTGSTRMKAGTATKMVLNTISTALMVRLGKCYENLMVDLRASNAKLLDRAARILSALTGVSRDEAIDLLVAPQADGGAGGDLKVAIVMKRRGLDAAGAREALARAGGSLRGALDGA